MGKWTLGRDGANACMIYEGAEPVAQVYGLWMHSALSTLEEAARLNPKSYAVPLARARLIAAAPAMAEALERARKVILQITLAATEEDGISADNGDRAWFAEHGQEALKQIDAALASAKGTAQGETT